METLRDAYNSIIEDYDPFYEPEEEPSEEDMIYNLREILKDFKNDPSEDVAGFITRIEKVLEDWEV